MKGAVHPLSPEQGKDRTDPEGGLRDSGFVRALEQPVFCPRLLAVAREEDRRGGKTQPKTASPTRNAGAAISPVSDGSYLPFSESPCVLLEFALPVLLELP